MLLALNLSISVNYVFRDSPIWVISKGALSCIATNRLVSMAEPKMHHKDFQIPKSVYTEISSSAKNATPSDRIQTLAKPKPTTELAIKPGKYV